MIRFIVHGLIGLLLWAMLIWSATKVGETARYDCSLANFHPDYPTKVRKTCRETSQLTNTEHRKKKP